VLNPVAWPGETLVMTSPGFALVDSPLVWLDSLPLAVTRSDDSSFTGVLPRRTGAFRLTVRIGALVRVGTIRTTGLIRTRTGPALSGLPQPLEPGSPVVLAVGDSVLMRVNMTTATGQSLGIAHHAGCSASPGPSYRDAAVVVQGGSPSYPYHCTAPASVALATPLSALDTLPGAYAGGRASFWAQLAPAVWMLAEHHQLDILRAGQAQQSLQLEEAYRMVVSPDRSLAVPLANLAFAGMPVLEMSTGAMKYRLAFNRMQAAAFTPSGDTLFGIGSVDSTPASPRTPVPRRLAALSPLTGGELRSAPNAIGGTDFWDIVLDEAAPRLYAVGFGPSGVEVDAFDRATLRPFASMTLPVPDENCYSWCPLALAIDPAARRLYLLTIPSWGSFDARLRSLVHEFELPPVSQAPLVLDR
jgi:hypothetical protein